MAVGRRRLGGARRRGRGREVVEERGDDVEQARLPGGVRARARAGQAAAAGCADGDAARAAVAAIDWSEPRAMRFAKTMDLLPGYALILWLNPV